MYSRAIDYTGEKEPLDLNYKSRCSTRYNPAVVGKTKVIMRILIIFIGLLIVSCSSINKKIKKNKYTFTLSIGSCFKKDKILVKLNDTLLLDNVLVTSNEYSGFSDIGMTYYKTSKESIIITNLEDRDVMKRSYFDLNALLLEVYRNNQKNTFYLDLEKGNHIVINGCDGGFKKKVSVSYYKGIIYYD